MQINVRISNRSERKKNKKSEWLYVNLGKFNIKKVILTRDKELIKPNPYFDFENYRYYLGEDSYLEMVDHKKWITHYNKFVRYNPTKSIQIEVSNAEGETQLIFEDKLILYNVENVSVEDKNYCKVNLEDYNINLYLPTTTQIKYEEIKNEL